MAEIELRLPAFDEGRHPPKSRWRGVIVALSLAVTAGGLAAALWLGNLGYDVRRNHMHDARLKGILVQTPTVYQVTEGLKEKAPLVAIVENDADLDAAVAKWGMEKAEDIRRKAAEWPQLRIYDAGDMIYFIYFDDTDIMQDYVYVSS